MLAPSLGIGNVRIQRGGRPTNSNRDHRGLEPDLPNRTWAYSAGRTLQMNLANRSRPSQPSQHPILDQAGPQCPIGKLFQLRRFLDQFSALRNREARLLAENVLTGLRHHRHGNMPMIRGNHHCINVVSPNNFAKILVCHAIGVAISLADDDLGRISRRELAIANCNDMLVIRQKPAKFIRIPWPPIPMNPNVIRFEGAVAPNNFEGRMRGAVATTLAATERLKNWRRFMGWATDSKCSVIARALLNLLEDRFPIKA